MDENEIQLHKQNKYIAFMNIRSYNKAEVSNLNITMQCYKSTLPHGKDYCAKMHSHDSYEIYCFLAGEAEYCVEGRRYSLEPGDLIVLQKGEIHLAEVRGEEAYTRIGVHFSSDELPQDLLSPFYDRPAGKFNHYPARLFPDNHWVHYLEKMYAHKSQITEYCFLLPLLAELTEQFQYLQKADLLAEKDPAAPIMRYINDHLCEELSLESLSRQFFISQTHLNRLFRKSAGITVWEYITVKRLFTAKYLLENGQPATQVFSRCGFSDYSTFFRAYKRRFRVSPSAHMKKH